jgi:hypothetical protein
MKLRLKFTVLIFLAVMLVHISCKKEVSCENCGVNRPGSNNKLPIANAGPDHSITLPTDSILLDGNASSDPDGIISDWLWTKIEGPASFAIDNSTTSKTVVKNLSAGIYHFEKNKPPISNAGPDQGNHFTT